jgi:hypothetical protein
MTLLKKRSKEWSMWDNIRRECKSMMLLRKKRKNSLFKVLIKLSHR